MVTPEKSKAWAWRSDGPKKEVSMRKSMTLFAVGLAALGVACSGGAALAQTAQFIPLDAVCGPAFFPQFCVVDMSGDGNTILFQNKIWTADGGFEPIGGPEGGFQVTALSDDGTTVVGDVLVIDSPLGPHLEAAIWLGGDQWLPLGGLPGSEPCGTNFTSAFDVSGTGTKVVGLAWVGAACTDAHAFEWTESTGMVDLGSIAPNRASRANAISADGEVIAGWSDANTGARLAATWSHGGPPAWLVPPPSKISVGEANGISSDGSIVVGGAYNDYTNPKKPGKLFEPWIWTADSGVVPLGTAKGLRGDIVDGQHYARDVSDDGNVVVGQDTLFNLGEQWAFIWVRGQGIKLLQDYLRANTDPLTKAKICTGQRSIQQPCSGWDFWNVAAVSNDGKIIVGTGANPDKNFQAFKIILP